MGFSGHSTGGAPGERPEGDERRPASARMRDRIFERGGTQRPEAVTGRRHAPLHGFEFGPVGPNACLERAGDVEK
ncbi:MAG: hypothetical protein C3F11_06465 [Methylocystaceae bacterium]|nr:MAG: hypothetical protein C3F11_06465 [Methylocystaceae bacterium]